VSNVLAIIKCIFLTKKLKSSNFHIKKVRIIFDFHRINQHPKKISQGKEKEKTLFEN
jgi:hypothetical protein